MKNELATKADLAQLSVATKADIAALETRVVAEIANSRVEMIKWAVGAMIGLSAIFAAIARLG